LSKRETDVTSSSSRSIHLDHGDVEIMMDHANDTRSAYHILEEHPQTNVILRNHMSSRIGQTTTVENIVGSSVDRNISDLRRAVRIAGLSLTSEK
jgi:hypothetical protein